MKLFKKRYIIPVFLSIVISAGSLLLALNIVERKSEGKFTVVELKKIGDLEDDPAVGGASFPFHYDDYLKNVDQERTKHGGSEAIPNYNIKNDSREMLSQDKLKEDPRLVTLWAGYGFSKDFREERGHAYMLTDQIHTGRQKSGQPGTCLNCHASTYKAMMTLGEGDLYKGFHKMNQMPYMEAVKNVKHPVSCIDCHDPKDMKLRVTRPAFIEGIKAYKKSQGINDYDVNTMASRQEMRTYACAQCHVEYYFKGKKKVLTYPWSKGLRAEDALAYYDEEKFKDWTHKLTGAPVLKAQHPEFEMFSMSIHAKSGVSCVDCHMPYKKVGAIKITDHQINSPVLKINRSCRTCHNVPEAELVDRVNEIQDKHIEMKDTAFNALIAYIKKLEKNQSHPKIEELRKLQREAQFLFDFVEAENSTGFHAPQESARVLIKSLDKVRQGEILLGL